MAINPVFTVTDFVNFFKGLPPSIGSLYNNSFPYNCLYYSHDYNGVPVYTADCWNLLKAGIYGDLTLPQHIGEYWYYPGKYGLQDWNGFQILQVCTDVSSDFSSIVPGEYLITNDYGHAGLYIGNVTTAAGTFNVVECTPIWANGIQYTWVDSDGTRRRKQGGEQSVYWARHAKLPWVDYSDTPPSPPDPPDPPQPPPPSAFGLGMILGPAWSYDDTVFCWQTLKGYYLCRAPFKTKLYKYEGSRTGREQLSMEWSVMRQYYYAGLVNFSDLRVLSIFKQIFKID